MNPRVDFYFQQAGKWQPCLEMLRDYVLESGLAEELKWGVPCYTLQGRNVLLLHHFKAYCAILFVKGVMLADPAGMLVQQTENTQAHRQLRFTGVQELAEQEPVIKAYIRAALEVEQAGLKVPLAKSSELLLPDEFKQKMADMPALKSAFRALTPGRQRAYALYFSAPKQAKTRVARVEKCAPLIMRGKGLNDA